MKKDFPLKYLCIHLIFIIIICVPSLPLWAANLSFNKRAVVQAHGALAESVLVAANRIYSGDRFGIVSVSSADDGKTFWSRDLKESSPMGLQAISALSLSSDGFILLAYRSDGVFFVLDAIDGAIKYSFKTNRQLYFRSCDFSPDGDTFACGDDGGDIYLGRLSYRGIDRIGSHEWGIIKVRFSSEDFLYVADPKGIKLWDIHLKQIIRSVYDPLNPSFEGIWVTSLGYSDDFNYALIASENKLLIVEIASGGIALRLDLPEESQILFSRLVDNGTKVLIGERDNIVSLWDVQTLKQISMVALVGFNWTIDILPVPAMNRVVLSAWKIDVFGGSQGFVPELSLWEYSTQN
jgi:WD40 repeat protein